ncbi:MAG: hypothetical protein HY595_06145 [Candidatus Omnitrophica bacterium]|nr:hypothetical protein [Candidatus Omnitrophota bacterium]
MPGWTVLGLLIGCCVAASAVVLAWTSSWHSDTVQRITGFLATLPILLVWSRHPSERFLLGTFVTYWAAVGTLLGWLAGRRSALWTMTLCGEAHE